MRLLLVVAAALALAAPALAGPPTLSDLEDEVVCPTCKVTLDQSDAPVADRMRAFIRARIAAGDSKQEIKDELVAQFGPRVLAVPEKRGFDLLAWVLPIGGALLAAGVVAIAAWRWSRAPEPAPAEVPVASNGRGGLGPELERRVDEELARFDG
jgi:cytochrome c-type biogenesis protein CcmH